MKTTSYETERLIITPSSVEDAPFFFKIMNTPKYIENIGDRKIKTLEDAQNYIAEKILPQFEKLGYGNYTVALKSNGEKIGFCGIYLRPNLDCPDIGFAFLADYEGKGCAYESSVVLKQWAKEKFYIKKLGGITIESNLQSRKLLERLGLSFQKKFFMNEDSEELMYYEITL